MPFIAITERAFALLVNEQYAVLERGTQVHERLERLVIEGAGSRPCSARWRARSAARRSCRTRRGESSPATPRKGGPGAAALEALARELADAAGRPATVTAFAPEHPSLADRALAVPVPARGAAAPRSRG